MTKLEPLVRVRKATPLTGFHMLIEFEDGTEKEMDLTPFLEGPIFEPIRNDPEMFQDVRIEGNTIAWRNGADIDPDVLYYDDLMPAQASKPITYLKIIGAYKGIINNYRLEKVSVIRGEVEGYIEVGQPFLHKNEDVKLFYKEKTWRGLLKVIDQSFPNQLDVPLIYKYLFNSVVTWIIQENDRNDQNKLEEFAREFINKIKTDLKLRRVYIPLEGLEVETNSLQIIHCTLSHHSKNSELVQLSKELKQRLNDIDFFGDDYLNNITAYFTYEVIAHPQKAIQRGIEKANLALDIIRLFVSYAIFYEPWEDSVVYRMGLAGSLHLDEELKIFHIDPNAPIKSQYPGLKTNVTRLQNLKLDKKVWEDMKRCGFDRINTLLQSLDLNSKQDSLARRLRLAIRWFAKGTQATSITDSYLMYAIAIEGLLSGKERTSKETYAKRVANLITSNLEDLILPRRDYISDELANNLKQVKSLNDKFNFIRDRVITLFKYRNEIAHGSALDHEIELIDLLEFETMVRNVILSFVMNDWKSLQEFKEWVNKSFVTLEGDSFLMKRISVSSSNLASVGFDSSKNILEIEFLSGSIYQYFDVSKDVYDGLMSADSHGQYFHRKIKQGGYSYKRVK